MASLERIVDLIEKRTVDKLIPIILESEKFKDNEGLRVKLWDTFLPPCSIEDEVHELTNTTIEQLEKDIERSFHQFQGSIRFII